MSNRVGLREDQQMGHGLAEKIIGWLPTPPVAVRLAGDSDLKYASPASRAATKTKLPANPEHTANPVAVRLAGDGV
jgi:hypothetical protein